MIGMFVPEIVKYSATPCFNCAQRLCFCSSALPKPRPVPDTKRGTKITLIAYTSPRYCRSILLAAGIFILQPYFFFFVVLVVRFVIVFFVDLVCCFLRTLFLSEIDFVIVSPFRNCALSFTFDSELS
jgi:hypothetical protein